VFKYYLPDNNGKPIEYESETNSIVIIGANGSGKSRLGAWMENNTDILMHRIGAQRSLQFGEFIKLKSFEQATNILFYGQENTKEKGPRFDWDGKKRNPVNTLHKDYENVLALIYAKFNNQIRRFYDECKEKDQNDQIHDQTPDTVINQFERIWNNIFPHRAISFDDSKVNVIFQSIIKNDEIKYNGMEMSDGEKTVLYLIAQCLAIEENMTIIIDEPGLHLHKSIMNKLWSAVERERPDCLFIYITHDTRFAANHSLSDKIWVKSYDGSNWEFKKIEGSELPEELLLDILGNRKNVLFVEGERGNLDHSLYSSIYKDYYVVPCGSCSNVIRQTKAMKAHQQLHHLKCFGIIDRDYRSDHEIEKYKKEGIYTLEVAEVENLFIVEELLEYVSKIQDFNSHDEIEKTKTYVTRTRFHNQVSSQISEAIVSELKFKLSTLEISKKGVELEKGLSNVKDAINFESIKNKITKKFTAIKDDGSYKKVLEVFNCKSLAKSIGKFFGLDNKDYCGNIIRKINGRDRQEIIDALKPYLPEEISIEQSN
jgi:ABC-type dipeptide/oligopeptide/nickel transport system ATPase subunit